MFLRFVSWRAGCGLRPAAHQIGLVGLVLAHEGELLAVLERRVVGERHVAEAGHFGLGGIGEPIGRALELDLVDRRAVRLDGDDGLHQVRPLVGDRPAHGAGLRVGEQDRRADLVEQRRAGVAIELLLLGEILQRRKLRGVERVEDRIAGLRRARPLGVQMRLRPQSYSAPARRSAAARARAWAPRRHHSCRSNSRSARAPPDRPHRRRSRGAGNIAPNLRGRRACR